MIKEFTLDLNKWICGSPVDNGEIKNFTLGKGNTNLRNSKGYSCCLGQFAKQAGFSIKTMKISENAYPSDLSYYVDTDKQRWFVQTFSNVENSFVDINDDLDYPRKIKEKIKAIRELLNGMGIELKVKE